MNPMVKDVISLYCDCYQSLKKPLYWKAASMYIKLCALSYAYEGHTVDAEKLLEAIDYIRKNTKWYSFLRASRVYSAAYLISAKHNIESEFPRLVHCYETLKKAGFRSSDYLPIAAYALCATTPRGLEQTKAETARLIYEAMKKQHRFLTSSDDYASAVILASVDRPIDDMLKDAEQTYQLLKSSGLYIGNGLQLLSQILVFDGSSPEEKAYRCKQIAEKLKERKQRVSSMYYGTIGLLALTGDQWQQAVQDVVEAIDEMKARGLHRLGERELNMIIAAALVCKAYLSAQNQSASTLLRVVIGTTVQSVIAAQTAAAASAT